MEGLLNIIQSLSKGPNEKAFPQFVKAYSEHQSLQLQNLSSNDGIIQHITSLMSKQETRQNGYLILTSCLSQFPLDIIEQKSTLWSNLAIKACSQKGSDDIAPLGFRLLKLLALQSQHIPDLSKSFASNTVSKIVEALYQCPSSGHLEGLKCLETCIRTFPGACNSIRGNIEKFILKFIDSTDENLVIWSAKCLHILQIVKGGSVEGLSAKQAWHFYQTKLVGNLHQLLNHLFANVTEFYDDNIEKATLKIPALKLSDEPVAKAYQLLCRINNLITFLIIALKDPYPVAKQVTPKKVLNLIVRGLSVNCIMLTKNAITDNLAIGAVLPSVQIQLFKLLDSLNTLMGSHMLQHYKAILSIIFDTFKWTETRKPTGKTKPYCQLRIAAYKSLSFWCKSMKFGSCVEIIADDLYKQIDSDISFFQAEMTLQVMSGAKKHMSKKARRQLHKAQNEASILNKKHSSAQTASKVVYTDEGNQELCVAALNCLRDILLSSSCFLKVTLIRDVHEKLVSILLALPNHYKSREKLYSNQSTRMALYKVLESTVIANNHLCPPPTHLVIKFLTIGFTEDPNETVRELCIYLLRGLEKVIHPQKDCLYFPPSINEIENVFSKYGRSLRVQKQDQSDEEDDDEECEEDKDSDEEEEEDSEGDIESDEESKAEDNEDKSEDNNEQLTKVVDLTEDSVVAMEVIETSDEDDCVVTEVSEEEVLQRPAEIEPMPSLLVESDDDDEVANTTESSKAEAESTTNDEPDCKKLKLVETIDEDALLEDIASSFVNELA